MPCLQQSMSAMGKDHIYIDANGSNALGEFGDAFYTYLENAYCRRAHIVVLCIGTDRITGDCLGPLIGHKLCKSTAHMSGIYIYGTLDAPVHGKNLEETLCLISAKHENPFVIAIDACLGQPRHIGYLTIGYGNLLPGAGVSKSLPPVGDIFIMGIVNFGGSLGFLALQNTRLGIVLKMADIIHQGLLRSFLKLKSEGVAQNTALF